MKTAGDLLMPSGGRSRTPAPVAAAFAPVGSLGADQVPGVAAGVARTVAHGQLWIAIDLRQVTDLDAVGLAFLKRVRRRLEARGGRLILRGASPAVAPMLDLCGIPHRAPTDRGRCGPGRALRAAPSGRPGR